MSDDSFRVWDFKNELPEDEEIRSTFMQATKKGAGANDPKNISFLGHQRNFEDVVEALENNRQPLITGEEGMKAVELICAMYESAKNNGEWVEL